MVPGSPGIFVRLKYQDGRFSLLRSSAGETDLEALVTDRWAASRPEHVLAHRVDESRRKAARQQAARKGRRAARAKR
jgi:transposase